MKFFKGKRIVVTGSCGTVGAEITRQLLADPDNSPLHVVGLDNRESELFFQEQRYIRDKRAIFYLCDLRDRDSLRRHLKDTDIVFHCAALKHVVMCERSPMEAVQSNIMGVQNLIDAALENNVERVIFTSSDKAVNPTNVMGTSKLMGERLITAANANRLNQRSVFCSTRFGNVLGSSGSVVPIFKAQIEKGGPVTVTDDGMTRFVMSVEEACRLVIEAARMAHGGEVFITKMPVLRIRDLAQVMIDELAPLHGHDPKSVKIEVIGVKPGEKLYEELMSDEETRRSMELKDFFCVTPAFRGFYASIDYAYGEPGKPVDNPYNSALEAPMSPGEIRTLLRELAILEPETEAPKPAARYWPGDKEMSK